MGGYSPPKCQRCGKAPGTTYNGLLGTWYCKPCNDYITKPDPKLEAAYNKRRSRDAKTS